MNLDASVSYPRAVESSRWREQQRAKGVDAARDPQTGRALSETCGAGTTRMRIDDRA